MGKYAISKEYALCRLFKAPAGNAKVASFFGSFLKTPKRLFRDPEMDARRITIPGYGGDEIEILLFSPGSLDSDAPCLVYFHGGGFLFPAAGPQYDVAVRYAKETPCKLVFVQYRLTPKHRFPIPVEDCYCGWKWTYDNAGQLGIDRKKIAVGGDSAGGCLAAAVSLMARDRSGIKPRFQLLVYPVTDRRMETASQKNYTDTPMWNSRLSEKMWQAYLPEKDFAEIAYASPMEAASFADLPDAYVETAEFDCLHDEGIGFAKALEKAGVPVTVNQTEGTVHGYDVITKAPTTQKSIAARIAYMREKFR